jgi:hypothetical protein
MRPVSARKLALDIQRIGIRSDPTRKSWMDVGLNDRFSTYGMES